jgi:uncharacterized RDD family membrane protein YckC
MSEPSTTAFRTSPEHGAAFSGVAPAPQPAPAPPAVAEAPAGFWPRLGAYAIDWLIIAGGWVVVALIATAGLSETLTTVAFLVLALFYWPIMWAFNGGATWGMQALDQRVVIHVDQSAIGPGRAVAREVARAALASLLLPSLVSAVMIGVRRDKRALHDLIAGTTVVKNRVQHDHT